MKKISILMLLLFMIPFIAHTETISSVYVDGKAPIIIDGDLSDWNSLDITPIKLTQFNAKYSNPDKWEGESDLSASFVCCADEDFVYIGVIVTDDQLVFGEAPIDRPYQDDCVELFFYVDGKNLPIHIWLTASKEGKTLVKSQNPFNKKYIPNLHKKQGLKALFRKVCNLGFFYEFAIPNETLYQYGWNKMIPLGVNVSVYDDDEHQNSDTILEWTKIWGESINKINFEKNIKYQINNNNEKEVKNEIHIIVDSPQLSANIINLEDLEIKFGYAEVYEKAGLFNEAIFELEKIEKLVSNADMKNKIKLAIARNQYYLGEYDKSLIYCNDLLISDVDLKIMLDANMILLSIKNKGILK